MMLQLHPRNNQLNRLSAYYAAQLVTKEWMQPVSEQHETFPVTIEETKNARRVTRPTKPKSSNAVTVYAVHRPDKQWSLLAINKNPNRAARLNVEFNIAGAKQPLSFAGQIEEIQFSPAQYTWHANGPDGLPIRSLPPARFISEPAASYELPPYSLTVLRGKLRE